MALLQKVRNSMNKYIQENPTDITVTKYPTKDNGYGLQIPDTTQTPVTTTLGTARVARRRLPDPIVTDARSPYDYLDAYYIVAGYDATWLRRGLIFEYSNRRFRTLLVEDRMIGKGVAYKICDLEEVTPSDGSVMYE